MSATMRKFTKWAQKNQALIAGFGGTGMLIANEWHGRRDIKDDMGKKAEAETDKIKKHVDGQVADLRSEHEVTQGLVLSFAVKTMKARWR